MADNDIYFGFIFNTWHGTKSLVGRIAVLGKNINNKWCALNKDAICEEVGESKCVFITSLDETMLERVGRLVRFRVSENENDLKEGHDIFIVRPEKSINREGAFIYPFSGTPNRDSIHEALESYQKQFSNDSYLRIFLKRTTIQGCELIGPFETDKPGNLPMKDSSRVYSWDIVASNVINHEEHEILMVLPDQAEGKIIDLASGEELGKWLRNKLKKSKELDFLSKFDKIREGWRDELKKIVTNSAEKVDLDRLRWQTVDSIFDHFAHERKHLEELNDNLLFKQTLEDTIHQHQEELLAPARAQFEEKNANLEKQLADKREELETLHLKLKQLEQNKAELSRETAAIQERFKSSSKQLFQDFLAFRTLLEGPLPPAITHTEQLPKVSCENPLSDNTTFVESRLLPLAQSWDARITLKRAHHVHIALLACKLILLPNPAWIRAYHEALGPTSLLKVIQVKPTWLGFDEAWAAGIGEFWATAVRNPDRLFFLYLQDIDRALMEVWARPLLDLNAGFLDVLPTAPFAWPDNLRVVMTKAKDEAVLPISDYVRAHFASLPEFQPENHQESAPLQVTGYVPADIWLAWSSVDGPPLSMANVINSEAVPKELARMLKNDLHRLQTVAARCYQGENPENIALSIRIKWVEP